MSFRTLVILFALLATTLSAQVAPDGPQHPGFDPGGVMRRFSQQHGAEWQVHWDRARGVPQFVFGGQRALLAAGATSDQAFVEAARAQIDELSGALGFDSSTLQLDRVHHIALAAQGSSDKVVVKFSQVTKGVPTWGGHVNVLFSADGKLLAVDNLALPHAAETALDFTNDQGTAAGVARAAFAADTGLPLASLQADGYVLYPARLDARKDAVTAVPAYMFKLAAARNVLSGATPVAREYVVAARGAATVLGSWSLVHDADITGTVNGWGQTGFDADGWAPDVLHALRDVRLTATGVPTVYSDNAGNFNMPNQASPKLVTASFNGQFSAVDNAAGVESTIALTLNPGAPQTFTFNTALTEQQTAEVNAHTSVGRFREWLKGVDPLETKMDFQVVSHVNEADVCNAFYDGVSLNFFLTGGGCPNSAYSTVVWHEEGHWANDLFGSFNGPDGFGEGAADCWSMYISDQPIIAANFFGAGIPIRTGLNNTQFCGDANGGCYGEPHADGEPLMGAIWKVRSRLETALGGASGGDVANHLLVDWFQVFNDSQIKSVIEEHWLALDDNDGNINNGTPHYLQIDGGFKDQGFPGFQLPLFTITHAPITGVNTEASVTVNCNVVEANGILNAVTIFYTVNGGQSFASVPMVHGAGTSWSGQIPGTASPAVVGYYIRATNAANVGNNFPPKAPADFISYDVGTLTVHSFYNFEPVGDEGWTHQLVLKQDDWQHGTVNGQSLDPAAPWSGAGAWGNDLGPSGWNGQYQPDVSNSLTSPVFNLTGKTNVHLRFRRWLTVEKGIFDHAEIFVNGTKIYTNPSATDQVDASWVFQDFNLGAIANNNPSVQVKFTLVTDPGLEFGGWNIDDFAIVSLGPVTAGGFAEYGTPTPGFGGMAPHLMGTGNTTLGSTVTLSVINGKPNAAGALFVGTTQISSPSKFGTFLVGNLLFTLAVPLNGTGSMFVAGNLPTDPAASGITVTSQYWCVDPAGAKGFAGSNGLKFTIQ